MFILLGPAKYVYIYTRDSVHEKTDLVRTYLVILKSVVGVHAGGTVYPANYP